MVLLLVFHSSFKICSLASRTLSGVNWGFFRNNQGALSGGAAPSFFSHGILMGVGSILGDNNMKIYNLFVIRSLRDEIRPSLVGENVVEFCNQLSQWQNTAHSASEASRGYSRDLTCRISNNLTGTFPSATARPRWSRRSPSMSFLTLSFKVSLF